jgi:hypothetical protein
MQWQCLESKMAAAAWALIAFMALEDPTEIITEPQGYYASRESCQQAAERKKDVGWVLMQDWPKHDGRKIAGQKYSCTEFHRADLEGLQRVIDGLPGSK